LKANAPAHCAPSIRKNFLTARQSAAQPRRVPRPNLPGLPKGGAGSVRIWLATIIWPCSGDGSFILVQGMNSVGRTPSRRRAARYWVLIISLTVIGLEMLAKFVSAWIHRPRTP